MDDALATLQRCAELMGYDRLGYEWSGPHFKPAHHYLTQDGYPLGTTCWYVMVAWDKRQRFFGDTPAEAIMAAAAWVDAHIVAPQLEQK